MGESSTSYYCLPNERTSLLSCWTLLPQRCYNCTQMSGNSNPLEPCTTCTKKFLKSKPWRRKSFTRTTQEWTWLSINSCLKLLLLLPSLSSTVCYVFSRTMSGNRTSRLRLHGMILIASFLGMILLPLASSQGSLQPTPSVKCLVLPDAVVYVGSAFSYNISESVFDCDVDSIVVSETADRFLSHWLSYNSNKKQLYGVPSDKDEGTYNILVVALTKDKTVSGHVCGSRSLSIIVMPVSEQLPVSIYLGSGGFGSYDHNSVHILSCAPGTQAILGTVILNINMQSLNGHERMMLVLKMADHLKVDSSKVSFFSDEVSHPVTQQLDSPTVIAAGVGDGRFAKGSRSLLMWNMGCGAIKLTDAGFSRLETAAQDGTISTLMGVPIVGWHVMSGTQKDMTWRRVRRQVQGIWGNTPTPTTSSAPPSRLSNMSTLVIASKTVNFTSALSQNSTVGLSSVTSNRTVTKTPSVSINATLFSQPPTRTIQSPTVSVNLTLSSLVPNRTVVETPIVSINSTLLSQLPTRTVQSSTVSINSTVSSREPNRTVVPSSSVSTNLTMSSLVPNRTDVSSSSVTVNLTVSSQLPNRTVFTSPSVSFNLATSSESFNETGTQSSSIVSLISQATSIVGSSKFMPTLTVKSSTIQGSTTVFSANTTTILELPTPSLNSTFVGTTAVSSIPSSAFISSFSFPTATVRINSSSIALSQNESMVSSILSSPIVSTLSTSRVVTSSARVPSESLGNVSMAMTSSITVSVNRTILVSSLSLVSSASPVLTTRRSTSVTVSSSITQLSSSLLSVTSPTLTTRLTPTETAAPSSSMTAANTSVPVTSSVSQTSTLSTSASPSLILLTPNVTLVENVTSSAMTSPFVASSMVASSLTPQLANSTVSNRTSSMLKSSMLTVSVVPTMSSTERPSVKATSLVSPSLSTSVVMLSSSMIQPSSSSVSPSSSATVIVTAVVQPFSSATLQANVTFPTTVILSLSMSSPTVTSVNSTSLVTSVNATTTKRTALVNSTSKIDRSSIVTTSVFPPTGTSGTRTFPGTFVANRTVLPSISEGVEKSIINISSTQKITTAFLPSPASSLSTSQTKSVVSSVEFTLNFTTLINSSLVTMSASLTTSSVVRVNSTIVSSTKEGSPALSSTATKRLNSSVSAKRTLPSTLLGVRSTSVLPSSSGRLILNSSLTTTIFSSSKPILVSSPSVLANVSSVVAVSKTSLPFPSAVTRADTAVMNSSRTVMPSPETNLRISPSVISSTLVTSTLKSQHLTTVFSRSEVLKSSEILQNSTTVFGANRTVSTSSSSVSSTVSLRRSTTGINSTQTRMPSVTVVETSAIVLPPSATAIPTSVTVLPTSATGTSVISTQVTSSTRVPSSSSRLASVFSGIPSSVELSATVKPTLGLPVNRTTSILGTSGSPSVASRNTTKVALKSTQVKANSSTAPSHSTVGSRMTTVRFSSAQINSTAITHSNATTITRKRSTVLITPSSFARSSTSTVTQTSTLKLIQSSRTFTRMASIISSVTLVHVTDSSVRITPSIVTSSISPDVSTFSLSRVESKLQRRSFTDTATSRMTISVTSLAAPSVTPSLNRSLSVTIQTEFSIKTFIAKSSSVTPTVTTIILQSKRTSNMPSAVSTARSIVNVTQSLDQRTALPSRSLTSSSLQSSELRSPTASLATRILTFSARSPTGVDISTKIATTLSSSLSSITTTDREVPSSSPIKATETSVTHRSFTPNLSTLEVTLTTVKTASLSSSLSEISSVISRIPTLSLSAVSLSSRPLASSSSRSPSNTTHTVTAIDTTQTISVSSSSTAVVIPTTAPPNLPPRVINNLGRVIAPAGIALQYSIPADTFYDREDRADTRNLSLSMTLTNGSSIPEDFWLQFDTNSQTINGLPLPEHVPDGILGQVLVVKARDSRGADALDAFEVLVIPSEKPVVQELKIRITNEFDVFNRDVAQRLLLLKKIAAYYGDADESNIRVLSFAPGSVIMTWTNDSLPTDRCDEEKVQYVANKILSNGEVKTEFRDALEGFPVVSASEERLGVCNGSYPVTTDQPIVPGEQQSGMEENLWYKHVLVGVLVVLILIVLAVLLIWCYRRRRPKPSSEKRTYKKRKPVILGPEIELKPIPGKPLVLPDDTPSFPPSYISETSLDKPVSSDGEDEEDYGRRRRSPGVKYEPPPPFYRSPAAYENPRHSPPPAYQLPPMY